jgi:site-specific recombinase XerD
MAQKGIKAKVVKMLSRLFNRPNKHLIHAKRRTRGPNSKITQTLTWSSFFSPARAVFYEYNFNRQTVAKAEPTQSATTEAQRLAVDRNMPPVAWAYDKEFWAFVDSFIQEQRSEHTKRAYEKDLLDFLTFMATTKKPMNVHTLVTYRNRLEVTPSGQTGKPLSRVSINRRMATVKSFLNWLVLNGVIPNNPAKAVKSFRAGRESPTRDLPDDLVRRIFMMPSTHTKAGIMHKAILMVLFRLGLRRSELTALRTSDIFEESGMRVIRIKGKGDKERLLPLPADVERAILNYLRIAKKDLHVDQVLFTPVKNNATGIMNKELNGNAVAFIVKKYAKLAGVKYRVSPHSARATAVSNALDHKAPHRAVQYMAGWSTPLMVTRYDKRKADLKNSAVPYVHYDNDEPVDEIL